jgi:16S rRNA (guanine1516-N2)-methyltransferase
MRIALTFLNLQNRQKAQSFAKKINIPFIENNDKYFPKAAAKNIKNFPKPSLYHTEDFDYLLILTASHLELQKLDQTTEGPLFIDFLGGPVAFRRKKIGHEKELLAKAVGIKSHYHPTIIDATAGLGEDSYVLACLRCQITMLERSPIIAALLQDALERLFANDSSKDLKINLIQTNAILFLSTLSEENKPDVVYLDPMFPTRRKSALVKKEMRILREIIGEDDDAETLLEIAIKTARNRVVVKRPRLASNLSEKKPDFSITGKNMRFDIYLTAAPSIKTTF